MAELKKLYVVENPTLDSELRDICYETTITRLFFIAKGTMTDPDTLDIKCYTTFEEAKKDAKKRLASRK